MRKYSYFWDSATASPTGANEKEAAVGDRQTVRNPAWFANAIRAGDAKIKARCADNVESILKNCILLASANEELSKSEFVELYRDQLEYSKQKVSNLLTIAKDARIGRADHDLLPPHWQTLYQLTRLTDEQFQQGLDSRVIHAEMQRSEIAKLRPAKAKRKKLPERTFMLSRQSDS